MCCKVTTHTALASRLTGPYLSARAGIAWNQLGKCSKDGSDSDILYYSGICLPRHRRNFVFGTVRFREIGTGSSEASKR